ncbi:exodeoxyribonuclease V subunit alpha [Shewanella olleyana]|uniref:exodeoxyribonuclease V subunit alpha n=1 Tax=Shewanella olleyana TaxID=135626 RepID=UPI00200C4844|nr:exodeoxyribonuclease V subunit alpha [Shewanella olleyana]MCL1065461.1 exodeoxyribonuclease V subunit alpha [Shewanella olleyana]
MSQLLQLHAPIKDLLKHWQQQGLITPLDRHFALEMANMQAKQADKIKANSTAYIKDQRQSNADHDDFLLFICALVSQQLSSQHSCLVINSIDLANPFCEQQSLCQLTIDHQQVADAIINLACVGKPYDNQPLIFEHGRLYLNKYYHFETQVADRLNQMAAIDLNVNTQVLPAYLNDLFDDVNSNTSAAINWQKVATATALTKALAVITGGPGTGKTTTVTKLLLLLLTQEALTIRLVAPTGKAAARLSESIKASKSRLLAQVSQTGKSELIDALNNIPEEAATLHRLLGVIPNSHAFRHHKDNPLRLDLLVVDEASMVDLPMMHKLLNALPSQSRLILLGDQDQLASVEAGAVLADICSGLANTQVNTPVSTAANPEITNEKSQPWRMRYSAKQAELLHQLTGEDTHQFIDQTPMIGDNLCMLMHSHRFKGDAGIGLLATAVNRVDINGIRREWQQGHQELTWIEHQAEGQSLQLLQAAVAAYSQYLQMVLDNQHHFEQGATEAGHNAADIIDSFNQFRILCAMRSGEFGVEGMNLAITNVLKQNHWIKPTQEFYLGRPIIIQSNDYNLGLFNGDIGLILQDELKPERLMAYFIKADGSLLKVQPARLPQHDSCFAMTVHKSQGSEFEQVAFVLPQKPSNAQWQLLTKELVYTAITRAKEHFICLGSPYVFERACKQVTSRASGLALRLWGKESESV